MAGHLRFEDEMGDSPLGKVHVVTGPGKGKTTAAFGLALRAAGHGMRVCVIQFMKSGMVTGEALAVQRVPKIQLHQFGTGKFVDLNHPSEDDMRLAKEALDHARNVLEGDECDMMILDEVNLAAAYGIVNPDDVIEILKSRRRGIEIVLTGRAAPEKFVDFADYVSYIDDRKHPLREGAKAREGVEW